MKHTKLQSTRCKNKLKEQFNYKESDFYFDEVWKCANSEDREESCFDVYNEKILSQKEQNIQEEFKPKLFLI